MRNNLLINFEYFTVREISIASVNSEFFHLAANDMLELKDVLRFP
jgi:hypothetical protein